MQNALTEHEMFEKYGGVETSKQGQAAETTSCQANNVGKFLQAFIYDNTENFLKARFHSV